MDCLGNPAALILHEQIINSRRSGRSNGNSSDGLLPDDGLDFSEEALPMSELPLSI